LAQREPARLTGDLLRIPDRLRNYFDFEAYASDADLSGERPRGASWFR
jgi:hypothetical protein